MIISISFEELHNYLATHYNADLTFSKVSERELSVTFTRKVLIKDVRISVNIHIDEVDSDSIALTYKGGMALDMIISGALNLLESKMPELSRGLTFDDSHGVRINLSEIEKTKTLVDKVALRDLIVDESNLTLLLALK